MSYGTIIFVEVEGVSEAKVAEVMDELGWDGQVNDVLGDTVYFSGSGSICMGTSEMKQEELVREAMEAVNADAEVSIFWDDE